MGSEDAERRKGGRIIVIAEAAVFTSLLGWGIGLVATQPHECDPHAVDMLRSTVIFHSIVWLYLLVAIVVPV